VPKPHTAVICCGGLPQTIPLFSLPLHLFPTNGLDRSLHAPVVIGLILVTFFTEAFGWTYAGLVVPGYLAATFAAAPVTACLVLFEALLTHWGVLLVASVIPRRTGAWSTAFGRERFFLYIVIAVIVRLAIEGSLVPWASARWPLSHSRELYSIGLVLVPLVAILVLTFAGGSLLWCKNPSPGA